MQTINEIFCKLCHVYRASNTRTVYFSSGNGNIAIRFLDGSSKITIALVPHTCLSVILFLLIEPRPQKIFHQSQDARYLSIDILIGGDCWLGYRPLAELKENARVVKRALCEIHADVLLFSVIKSYAMPDKIRVLAYSALKNICSPC